jgi:flagellar basal-body rod protein FlgC
MFDSLDIGASALLAQRTRMNCIAGNMANLNTLCNEKGEPVPYCRRIATFAACRADGGPGVHVATIEQDPAPFPLRHEPGSRFADKDGNVKYPNIDMATEYINMLEASRAYEANITMMETTKAMINSSLRLIA